MRIHECDTYDMTGMPPVDFGAKEWPSFEQVTIRAHLDVAAASHDRVRLSHPLLPAHWLEFAIGRVHANPTIVTLSGYGRVVPKERSSTP